MSIIVLVLFVSTGPAVRLARGMGFLEMIAAMFFAILTLILRTLG
jgi:hypothetical protein